MKELLERDMKTRVHQAMGNVWNTIGGELFAEGSVNKVSREEVIEVVLDSNYLETYGHDKEAVIELRKLPYEEQEKIAKMKFISEWYS